MKNLYRRYRPLRLSEVVGQEQVVEPLGKSLAQGKVGHAYLFVGPRGCGKTSVARILAHEINSFKYEIEDDYVDIIEIDGASNRGIDNIRELREKVMIAPTAGKYKVYIIDEVHMLTKEAFNALLKTLEEPPEHVVFIMATTDAHKVPVTITSRAQTYSFKLADSKVMLDFLKNVASKEKIPINDEALAVVAKRGEGSFRDSLSLLDQISTLSGNKITKEMVVSAMGLPEDEKVTELLSAYVLGDIAKITMVLQDLLSSGIKPETLTEELISTVVAEPKSELLPLLAKLPEVKAPYAEAKLLVAMLSGQSGHIFSGDGIAFARRHGESAPHSDATLRLRRTVVTSGSSREDSPRLPKTALTSFDWDKFTVKVRELNEAIYSQLIKTQHELVGNELHIYPMKKIVKNILARDNNKQVLIGAAQGVRITIHEADETPDGAEKDETLAKISAIMGGEVKNDGGGNPF